MDPREKRDDESWAEWVARVSAKSAVPAVDLVTDLSTSYIPDKFPKPLDIFREMVPPYNMDYTRPGGAISYDPSGTTYPQYDAAGNVRVYQGQGPITGQYRPMNPQWLALDAPTANYFAGATPEEVAAGEVKPGSKVRTGVLRPAEIIKGSFNEFLPSWEDPWSGDTYPGIKEIQITPSEIEKVVSGKGETAKTVRGTPPTKKAMSFIEKLETPLPGTGIETSWLGKAGPYVRGAGRLLGAAGYPLAVKAVADYWSDEQPVRTALAAGSMLPVVGPGFLAAEMLTNAVVDGVQPGDMPISPTRFGSDEPYAGMGSVGVDTPFSMETTHPGQGIGGYTLPEPSWAGIETGMDVAPDAGGAVGGGWADPPSLYPNQIGITPPAVERLPLSIENLAATGANIQGMMAALADPNITVQATQAAADARAAEYMAAAAGTQDMMAAGGVVGGGIGDFVKEWVGKADDARTVVTPAGPVKIGADSRGATFTLDVPPSRRQGPTVDAPPPNLIRAQEQVDMQAMLARSAQRLQDEQARQAQAEQARQAQVAQVTADAQAQAQQAQLAYAAMKSQLMQGRDRGEPSAREIQRAMERATQVDTFGGYGRQEGGGFDPQGGTTGSSGMGGWT
jgi:hypothetical protein